MSKHPLLMSRIWRTVVFSGAMLGAPLATAEDSKPTQKQKKPPPTPLEVATKELDDATKRVNEAIAAIEGAKSDADRTKAKTKLDAARKDKATAEAKLAALKPPPNQAPSVVKLEKELAAHDAKIAAAIDAVAHAKSDAERQRAAAQLETLRKERVVLDGKLTAERAKTSAKRPRTDDSERPTGRGFILS